MKRSIDRFNRQDEFIHRFYQALDCPRSLAAWMLYESSEHDQLVNLEFNPYHYATVDEADCALQATKFLSKATFLKTTVDRKAVAIEKFIEAEEVCARTNARMYRGLYSERAARVISIAQRKIAYILGSFSADEFADSADWGPGATTTVKRRDACKPIKYSIESGISRAAYDFVVPWFSLAYPGLKPEFGYDKGRGISKIVTVPKNAKTDRVIAIEPGWNLFFQKSVGSMIRRRLKRIGIDLNNQSHNADKARLGSKFNHLATVDFSSASDTISSALVRILFEQSTRWLALMEAFRSSSAFLDGRVLINNKFSSMGNGFTFELESLIFYVVGLAICQLNNVEDHDVSIYGDDLILPSSVIDDAHTIFAELGFTVNMKKSYSSSYYRESCGSHWWNGQNIKPIFQKEPLYARQAIYKAANSVRRLAHRRASFGCDRRFRRSWQLLADFLGEKALRIPDGLGDGGLVVSNDELPVFRRPKNGFEGYLVPMLASQPIGKPYQQVGLLYTRIREIGGSFDPTGIDSLLSLDVGLPTLKDKEIVLPMQTRDVKINILVPRWLDIGAWV